MKIYYNKETQKSLNNFQFSVNLVRKDFIYNIVKIKKSCAFANFKAGNFDSKIKDAIIKASDEILEGVFDNQFILPFFQGGAGTSINMNVNEVIATRATEILKGKIIVHPNDHVNCSQSTNDVNPSALRITAYLALGKLNIALNSLIKEFDNKAKENKGIYKLGRTHLQDAVPTTISAEFLAYKNILENHQKNINNLKNILLNLNLGGTAIGNCINTKDIYLKNVYLELKKITNINFKKADNLSAKTSSHSDFLIISQSITALCVDLSKIANDFRFLASGPKGGIGEIILPEIQNGSSIMPGKSNPIMPEILNQLYYLVSGNNLMIEKAVEASSLELGIMLPVIIEKLLESIILTEESINQFNKLCLSGLLVNADMCKEHLEKSTALSAFLIPVLGYDFVADLVKRSIESETSLKDLVILEGHLTEKEFENIIKNFIKK